MTTPIRYRKGYKYQLAAAVNIQTRLRPLLAINTPFLALSITGRLLIRPGYAWDGPSGPTFDTKSSMRGSLVHDALYQLLRAELLPASDRALADKELYRLCVEDKMWKWRAKLWLREVRKFAGSAADPKNVKKIYSAP